MALQLTVYRSGVTVPAAYLRIDRLVVEHKQSVYCVVRTYANATRAADRDALPVDVSFTFPWPCDEQGALLAVENPQAFAYTELKKLAAFAGAADI
jgi:hypothetical protein